LEEFNETLAPAAPETSAEPSLALRRLLLDVLETVLLAVVLFLVINALSARVNVDGTSMQPTLNDGEYILVNRTAYLFSEPERGDIIVFHYPRDPHSQDLIKRVIGIPGDTVVIENKMVIVNGTTLDEPYIASEPLYAGTWQVPDSSLFVLGDNRNNSSDSHQWGLVPYEQIIGKALVIYYPFKNFEVITHADLILSSQ
jgi:signal peptidase I